MISKIILKFGAASEQPPLQIDVTPITIFVGPNNSGKSRILIEIENYCRKTVGQSSDLILSKLDLMPYSKEEIENEIAAIEQTPQFGENINPGNVIIGKLNPQSNKVFRSPINKNGLIKEAQNPNIYQGYYSTFLNIYTLRLDGTNRLNLLNEQSAGDLQTTPINHLAHLFLNNKLRLEVRRIIYDAFNKYFIIDPTNIGKLRVRLSDREPISEREEKGWDSKSIEFHRAAVEIKNTSDGVKAFTGIITTVLAGDPKITLIDDPEAFLHPALSSKLGKELANALKKSRKRLFISTHSASFLMGCIQSGSPLNIVRLTYNYNPPTAMILPQEKLLPLMRNPLLRSTGVLNGLFYESAIVTESDTDRAFYQEINDRLLSVNDKRGISSCLFINAQNKQTVWEIVKPLRELGIPALAIVDIDILKEGGQNWKKVLIGTFIPELVHQTYATQRKAIYDAMIATGENMKRDGGVNILKGSNKEACVNLFEQMEEYGVLIVPEGELESWLKQLNSSGHGPKWLIETFEKMGDSHESTNYLLPKSGDVWDFLGKAKKWLINNERKGLPLS